MLRKSRVALIIGLAFYVALGCRATAFTLITDDEAKRPPGPLGPMGPIPGPIIQVISPMDDVPLFSPIRFVVRFRSFAMTLIDFDSLRFVYVKEPLIDLTERARKFLRLDPSGSSFILEDAEVPPGIHVIRIDVRDTAGRLGSSYIKFQVQ
jgi:hypothetical protein